MLAKGDKNSEFLYPAIDKELVMHDNTEYYKIKKLDFRGYLIDLVRKKYGKFSNDKIFYLIEVLQPVEVNLNWFTLTDEYIQILSNFYFIKRLYVNHCNLEARNVLLLTKMRSLEVLGISNNDLGDFNYFFETRNTSLKFVKGTNICTHDEEEYFNKNLIVLASLGNAAEYNFKY